MQKNKGPSGVPASVSVTKPFQVVYVDSSGKLRVASARNHRYFTVFVDDFSRRMNFTRKLMTELGFPPNGPKMLYEDNTGAIALAATGHFKGRPKHFDLRFKWVVDMLDLGLFKIDPVSSPDHHADTGTAARAALAIQKVVAAIYGHQIKH